DQLEQPATRVVIVLVRAEVLGELVDPARQHRDLDFRRAGVRLRAAVFLDDLLLLFLGEAHASPLVAVSGVPARRQGRRRTAEPRSPLRVADGRKVGCWAMHPGIAAGNPATAAAGAEILANGGNAADAAVAATLASCVAESIMTGLLGGGHAV